MAISLPSNLVFIKTGTVPTTSTLPYKHVAIGKIGGVSKIYYNNGDMIVDALLDAGLLIELLTSTGNSTTATMTQKAITDAINAAKPTVVQTTGTSTTSLMSQKATTDAINAAKPTVVQTTGTSTTSLMSQKAVSDQLDKKAGLDENGKVLPGVLPDFVISGMTNGGTINKTGLATLSESFKSRFNIASATLQLTASDYAAYPNTFFYAKDSTTFANQTILGVTAVSTGDWIVSHGTFWDKLDNTDAVKMVNNKTGNVVLTAGDVGAVATEGGNASVTEVTGISFTENPGTASGRGALSESGTLRSHLSKLNYNYWALEHGLGYARAGRGLQKTGDEVWVNYGQGLTAGGATGDEPLSVRLGLGLKFSNSGAVMVDIGQENSAQSAIINGLEVNEQGELSVRTSNLGVWIDNNGILSLRLGNGLKLDGALLVPDIEVEYKEI